MERLERNDIDGAIRALNLDEAAFRPLTKALAEAFEGGGVSTVDGMPALRDPDGHRILIRFDARAPRAEQYVRDHSSTLVKAITDDQREGARIALTNGLQRGDNPTRVALDLVGRRNKATGRREGGLLGITSKQAEYVETARQRLLSGDPDEISKVLELNRRDKRFDKSLRKMIAEGKAPDRAFVNRWIGRLNDNYLKLRGDTIARTETMTALNRGQIEAYEQAIASGAVDESLLTKKWIATLDGRTRDTHSLLNGKSVGFREKFQSAFGGQIAYPGDPEAPASERINCFAPWSRIALTGIRGAVAHRYSGELVQLAVGSKINLTVTPNHPVLTDKGWVPAGLVNEGDYLVECRIGNETAAFGAEPHVADVYARADEVYRSAKALGVHQRAGNHVVDFHGYVPDEDVDIVSVEVPLRGALDASLAKILDGFSLAETDLAHGLALFDRICGHGDRGRADGGSSQMSGFGARHPVFRIGERGGPTVAFRDIRGLPSKIGQAGVYCGPADTDFIGNAKNWISGIKEFANTIKMLSAALPCSLARLFGSIGEDVVLGDIGHPKVAKARNDDASRDSDLLGYRRRVHPGLAKLAYLIEVLFPASPPPFAVAIGGTSGDTGIRYDAMRRSVGDAVGKSRLIDCRAGLIGSDNGGNRPFIPVKVTAASRVHYEGPVYDFETDNGLILADNLVSHNCRCRMLVKIDHFRGLE